MKRKVLAFLDMEKGRDANIIIPVAFFAERYLDCEFIFRNKYDADAVYRYKPDLVMLPNSVGSPFYFKISRYAYQNNIKVFALVSEGNYWTNGVYDIFGSNTDRKFYHDHGFYWNERTMAYNKERYPELKDFFVMTGGIQFDRYKNYPFATKQEFLGKYNLGQYKKVVGYAAWGFGKLFNKRTMKDLRFVRPNDPDRIEWMKSFRPKVEATLRSVIEQNPDVLFILKKHPNESLPSDTTAAFNEIEALRGYKNVLYLVYEDIDSLLNVCDIWMGFDTTTVMEAWLMKNSPTFLLHTHQDFFRDEMYKGSVIIQSAEQLQGYIDEYYNRGEIADFRAIGSSRRQIINSVIGFSDGLNHARAGIYLRQVLATIEAGKTKRAKRSLLFFFRYLLITVLRPFYVRSLFLKIPKLKKAVWIFDNWRMDRFEAFRRFCYPHLERVHKKWNLQEIIRDESKTQKFLHEQLTENDN